MTIPLSANAIVETVTAWWRDRHEANRQLDELTALSYADLEEVASDCGLSTFELLEVVTAGPHGSDEMLQLMHALNIDPAAVEEQSPALYRDMQVNCARCGHKGTCRRELEEHTIGQHYNAYCNNAAHMNELRAEPNMLAE